MPRLSISSGSRSVTFTSDSNAAKLLQKRRFEFLRNLGPFYFCHVVQKLCKYSRRASRLCVLSESFLIGANASTGDVSFCLHIEDVAELITDSCYLAIGIRVRDTPFGTKKGLNTFADMPVDVLLFTPTPAVLNEFIEAFARLYEKCTNVAVPVRERLPRESFAATLTLNPEGRRVRFSNSTTILEKLPPLPYNSNWNGSETTTPILVTRNGSSAFETGALPTPTTAATPAAAYAGAGVEDRRQDEDDAASPSRSLFAPPSFRSGNTVGQRRLSHSEFSLPSRPEDRLSDVASDTSTVAHRCHNNLRGPMQNYNFRLGTGNG